MIPITLVQIVVAFIACPINAALPDTLLKPVNSETKANCACGKILNVEKANSGEFPWLVRLVNKNDIGSEPLCWGSLISDKYVISAAHCTSRYSSAEVEVVLGGGLFSQNPTREVASIKNHPGFQIGNGTYDNDISLIKLRLPVDLEVGDIVPVCLPPVPPPSFASNETIHNFTSHNVNCEFGESIDNKTMVISEFKGFENVDRKASPHFEKRTVHILANSTCVKLFPNRIKAQVLCGDIHKPMKDSGRCHNGDAGSPVLYLRRLKTNCDRDFNSTLGSKVPEATKFRFLQVGLVTKQPEPDPKLDCKLKSYKPMMVFTKITRYISWIRDNTDDGTSCVNSPY